MRARDFSTQPRASRGGLALTLVGALALGLAAQQAMTARAELGQAEGQLVEARREVKTLRERAKRTPARSTVEQGTLVRALAATESPPSQVVRDLVELMPSGVRVERLDLAYGREVEVEAQVVARRVADYDDFMERLSGSTRFESVAPGPETREAELRATVHAVYRSGSRR